MTRRLSYINNAIFGRNGVPHFQCSLHGLARAASASVTARAHHFFCVAEFRDSICRLCDDPDAFHVFSFRNAGNNSLNWRLTQQTTRCTFTEPGPSAFEPDSPTPVTTLTVTVLQTTSDRISTLPVAPVLAAHGCRQSSRLPFLEPTGVRAAQQSLG